MQLCPLSRIPVDFLSSDDRGFGLFRFSYSNRELDVAQYLAPASTWSKVRDHVVEICTYAWKLKKYYISCFQKHVM